MKLKFLYVVACTAAVGALAIAAPASADLKRITVGTNPAGSAYFMLGSGFAKLFQEELKIRSTAQPHAGSSVYLPLMDQGEITLGLNNSLDTGLAYNGKNPYSRPMKNVRTLVRVWILPYAYMAKANSGITKVEDLKGKRVVINVKTNVSLAEANKVLLSTGGLSPADVQEVDSGGVVEGIDLVVEGRADATTVAVSMPAMLKAHAAVPGGLRILTLGKRGTDEFLANGMPGLFTHTAMPTERQPFVKGETPIAAFDTLLNGSTALSDEDAYRLTKSVHENWKALQKDYAPLRNVQQDELAPPTNPAPYHPGAIKYYKEAGLWTEANDEHEATLK